MERVKTLLENQDNVENQESKGCVELNIMSDLVADFEEVNYEVP